MEEADWLRSRRNVVLDSLIIRDAAEIHISSAFFIKTLHELRCHPSELGFFSVTDLTIFSQLRCQEHGIAMAS